MNGGGGSGSSKGKVNGAILSASDFANGLSASVVETSLGELLASGGAFSLVEESKLPAAALWDPSLPDGGRATLLAGAHELRQKASSRICILIVPVMVMVTVSLSLSGVLLSSVAVTV